MRVHKAALLMRLPPCWDPYPHVGIPAIRNFPACPARARPMFSEAAVLSLLSENPSLREAVQGAFTAIHDVIASYGLSGVALCFNGGKDCTLLLYLLLIVLWDLHPSGLSSASVQVMYVASGDAFVEVEQFVACVAAAHPCLAMDRIEEPDVRSGLALYLSRHPEVKAMFLGTRRTDPYSATLPIYAPTDADWPQVLRVHPILDWDYHQVWSLIRLLRVPYCSLYEIGYTSLGSASNTLPNPILDGRPAWELARAEDERAGRIKRKKETVQK